MTDLAKRPAVIGESHVRPDALGKVTGAAEYPADRIRASMLHARVVFARTPRARLVRLDAAPALAMPDVAAVLTAADVPFNAFGLIEHDQPVLVPIGGEARFFGDKLAVVIAETPDAATAGARALDIELETLPPVLDPEAAMEPESPLVHEGHSSNVLLHVPIRKGDVGTALRNADVTVSGEFSTTWQEHAFLQPEAGTAWVDEDGRLVLETAGQWLHEDRRQIATMLEIEEERVIVRYNAIGGAFGGREDLSIQHVLALAAWTLRDAFPGRPVALQWTREDSIIGHHKRHPVRIRCTWGATTDGAITAARATVIADGGAYASTSAEVLKCASVFATGCYEIPNIATDGYVVYTNNVPSGAFRGFGAPQAQFAVESMIGRLASALGMDAVELRRRNIYRENSLEPTGNPLPPGVSALPVLDAAVECASGHFAPLREESLPPHIRRGFGFASGIKNVGYSFGYPDNATATVELFGRGEVERAIVRIGAADVGQGTHLALRQITSGVLNVPVDRIRMITDDSSQAPNAGSASASRLTLLAGGAVHQAATEALDAYLNSEETHVVVTANFRPPATTALDPVTGAGTPNFCYGYAAQAVAVDVDTVTGQVRVLSIISAHDVGTAINRQQVEGQIEGCLAQALGYALMEHIVSDRGRIANPHFSTYLLPTALDMPVDVVPVILELADPNGPFGARGMAEMPLVPFAGAVAAAIHDATGIWLSDLPFVPERVLSGILAS
ncbi:MAG TPA: xanthine dehydrogenase family protein molybdopterin-binding subunit [Thermomicrobiales bacterium]|nr:xanthine dehydrogenase family protein molybdopterin-binding subunit [Thermomicrobiales bacterium]